MSLAIGTPFGGYEVLALLGRGGMGEVYRARDRRLGRDVALKILPDEFAADDERLARFEREARLLASLSHPNIAGIYGLEESDGVKALVLEVVEGDTLADRIARGPCPLDEALGIAAQLADALEAAHKGGIVHRDLKPANVKLTPDGQVKVLDFGLARALGSGESGAIAGVSRASTVAAAATREGVIVGTVAYMSPEQARGEPVDRRTDVWAFGCVLYELLTGRAAFRGPSVTDTLVAVLEREPDWDALPRDTPASVRRVLRRCLAKPARHRLHDVADARLDLEDTADDRTVPASRAAPGSTRRERAAWVALLALLASLAGWLLYSRNATAEPPVVELAIPPPPGGSFVRLAGGPWPRVSPDGSMVAFVAISQTGQQIFVRSLDSTTVRPVEGTEGAIRPFWSPDSQSIGFFANGQLRRVDLGNRSVRVIADAPYSGGQAGTWGADTIVFAGAGGIRRVPAGGGSPTIVREVSDGLGVAVPSFLPDGRRFLYLTMLDGETKHEVCLASIDSPESRCAAEPTLPGMLAPSGHLVFVRDGTLQARAFDSTRLGFTGEAVTLTDASIDLGYVWQDPPFSVSHNAIAYYADPGRRLAWLDRSGAVVEVLPITGTAPAVSPDEQQVVVSRSDPKTLNADLWVYDRSQGTESRLTFTPVRDTWPAFSPDGTHVLYSTEPAQGLFQMPVIGGAARLVIDVDGTNPDWSSDGRFVVYQSSTPRTGFDIWVAPLSGVEAPFPVAQTEHGERDGAFSPDVRWIAYDSTESGRREVWVQPFPPTGARWQISTTGGVSPRWRADGRELFYVAADGSLTAVTVTPGPAFRWGAPRVLFHTMFRGGSYASIAVSKDGQRFLMPAPAGVVDEPPIIVVLNWTRKLPR